MPARDVFELAVETRTSAPPAVVPADIVEGAGEAMGVPFKSAVFEGAGYERAAAEGAPVKNAADELRLEEKGFREKRVIEAAVGDGAAQERGRNRDTELPFESAHAFESAEAEDVVSRVWLERVAIGFGELDFFNQAMTHAILASFQVLGFGRACSCQPASFKAKLGSSSPA